MNLGNLWFKFKDFLLIIATIISICSYWESRKVKKIEEKLKKYELEEKEKVREESTKTCVEARIMQISKDNYRLKIWNSGKATAYDVDFVIYEVRASRDKVPYEFLESGKSFEEIVAVHLQTPRKFKVTTNWTDEQGHSYKKDQIVTI